MKNNRHGHSPARRPSATYVSWQQMKDRCLNSKRKSFIYYGARGIGICERWRDSFENFLADMGARPPHTSLDRIDNSRGYEPDNCRWATRHQQMRNTRAVKLVAYKGEERPLAEWCEILGLPLKTIKARIGAYGWSIDRALETPVAPIPSARTHCKRGHQYNAENTRIDRSTGQRLCRVCDRENHQHYRLANVTAIERLLE